MLQEQLPENGMLFLQSYCVTYPFIRFIHFF